MAATSQQTRSVLAKFDPSAAKDEMNLCEFPIGYLGKKPPKGIKTLEFEDRVWDVAGNCYVPQKRTVIGSDKYGLPSWFDEDVLLALLQLSKLQTDFHSPHVHFSRYQIVELLQLNRSGKTYDRIREAILRLKAVTIECERSWYLKDQKNWNDGTLSVNILNAARVFDERACSREQPDLPLSHVVFSDEMFESLRSGFVRSFDLDRYNELKIPAAKRAMRYLGKCFHREDPWQEDFRSFNCEHLGFDRNYDNSNLKRHAKRYVDDLERVGIIKPMAFEKRITKGDTRGAYRMLFESPANDVVPAIIKPTQASLPIVNELVARGMTKATAQALAKDHDEDYIQAKIELLEWELVVGKKDIESPAGYLRSAIEKDFAAPKGFRTRKEREEVQRRIQAMKDEQAKKQQAAQEQQRLAFEEDSRREQQRWERVESYLETLAEEQRQELIDSALLKLNRFARKYVHEYLAHPEAGSMGETYYRDALVEHITPLLSQEAA